MLFPGMARLGPPVFTPARAALRAAHVATLSILTAPAVDRPTEHVAEARSAGRLPVAVAGSLEGTCRSGEVGWAGTCPRGAATQESRAEARARQHTLDAGRQAPRIGHGSGTTRTRT